MSSFSGLSAILTISLVALVTVQMLKDKFQMVENYGEHDDNGIYMEPYTTRPTSTAQNVSEVVERLPIKKNLNSFAPHGKVPFKAGDFFGPPLVGEDVNGWNGFSESYGVYLANLNSATPSINQLHSIGSETKHLPGPFSFTDNTYSEANVNTGRAANLSLCSQHYNTNAISAGGIASSLLPSPNHNNKLEGFQDCDFVNPLANQVFLTQRGGVNTISGSNRNSNQQIRSEPPCPINTVSPWLNSTIYPDLLNRPLEGCGSSFGTYGNGRNGSGIPISISP